MIAITKLLSKVKLAHILIVIIITLLGFNAIQKSIIQKTRAQLEITRNNEKAYAQGVEIWKDRYGQEHAKSLLFLETAKTLKSSADSLNRRLVEKLEKQDIKFKNLERLIYQRTEFDVEIGKNIYIPTMPDTTLDLSNEYVRNIITLSPTLVTSSIQLDNEIYGVFTRKKETILPPKKFFICRWFQKRHEVIEAQLFNTNPLISIKEQRIIQIIE